MMIEASRLEEIARNVNSAALEKVFTAMKKAAEEGLFSYEATLSKEQKITLEKLGYILTSYRGDKYKIQW